jgi:hypothetical protein
MLFLDHCDSFNTYVNPALYACYFFEIKNVAIEEELLPGFRRGTISRRETINTMSVKGTPIRMSTRR